MLFATYLLLSLFSMPNRHFVNFEQSPSWKKSDSYVHRAFQTWRSQVFSLSFKISRGHGDMMNKQDWAAFYCSWEFTVCAAIFSVGAGLLCNSELKIGHRMKARCLSPVLSGFYNHKQPAELLWWAQFSVFQSFCLFSGGFDFLSLEFGVCLRERETEENPNL